METKRPTTPAAEEILGGYFPVLDHGFVSLVDYMGGDEDVERAARVSYGYGTRKVSQTRGLIRYLRRHRHTTPSEMVELKFHVAMPIFIARQWIRHRTACLAEGTEVYFDLPGGVRKRGNQLYKLKIEDLWERFQPTRNPTRPDEQRDPWFRRDRVQGLRLRQVDEDSLRIRHSRVMNVYRNGTKPVFRMTLADGKVIEATADHRFLSADGWATLHEQTGVIAVGDRAVWNQGDFYLYVNGTTTTVPASRQDAACTTQASGRVHGHELDYVQRLGGGSPIQEEWEPRPHVPAKGLETAKLVRIERFEYIGEKETYDLEVEGPFHNFIANGIVTHNSINEYSGRYSLMPLLFYTPRPGEFALQSQANRQGRAEGASPELYAEAVRRWEELRGLSGSAYSWLVGEDVARELARIDLPLSTYTQWYWKVDLHNLLHFLSLRVDAHAQWEIREYGKVIAAMLRRVAPLTYEAWIDYDVAGRPFSRAEREAIARLVQVTEGGLRAREGASLGRDALTAMGVSAREWAELVEKLAVPERPEFELDLSTMRPAEEVGREMERAVPGAFE